MSPSSFTRTALLMCLGFVVVQSAGAAEPATRIKVTDIALAANGTLVGKVVNQEGAAIGGTKVTVYHNKNVVAKAVSDKKGAFLISKLRGGNHTIVTKQSTQQCRLWTEKAAPPSAAKQILLVSDGKAVRGQYPAESYGSGLFGTGSLLTGGIGVAGALGAIWGFNHGLDRDTSPASP